VLGTSGSDLEICSYQKHDITGTT